MRLVTPFIVASFIALPTSNQHLSVSRLEMSGKSMQNALEHPELLEESKLDYDETLLLSREILKDPNVKDVYEQEIKRQKREFLKLSKKIKKSAAGLTLEDIQKQNSVSFGVGERGPTALLKFVKKIDDTTDPRVLEFVSYEAFRDENGKVHIEPVQSSGAPEVAE